MMATINMISIILIVFISIAFFTLMERKVISYTQNRKGPNKSSINGITQPMADAVKLMNKEINMNYKSNFIMFMVSPTINITCSIMMWFIYPSMFSFKFMKMSMVYIICCMSVNIIAVLTMSWSSNSNYSLLGMMRTVSQLVSYEINMMMIILLSINMSEQMNLEHMTALTKSSPISLMMSITLMMRMITSLAETNRTPFDFSEGESELISGFNVEFSGKSFMFLFLAEYSSILIMAMMTTTLFFSAALPSPEFVLVYLALCFTFVWTRTSLPRFRYDKLMKINWQQILPTTMTALMLSFSLKLYYTKKYK
uniref:NADH-ubiquinone oxidoreductase chain 1 n=1 Tax=Trialeurodes vaporariorum TaxID=88556 RepID=Q6JCQ0_TRIVP|nr:NADH dehydrogenase subunit 1 [Trialeurodes vaporariorum]AAS77787.1 NADH dehydrogenase subunit 1 [Trialeurodes vaporariorum]